MYSKASAASHYCFAKALFRCFELPFGLLLPHSFCCIRRLLPVQTNVLKRLGFGTQACFCGSCWPCVLCCIWKCLLHWEMSDGCDQDFERTIFRVLRSRFGGFCWCQGWCLIGGFCSVSGFGSAFGGSAHFMGCAVFVVSAAFWPYVI